MLLFGLDSYIGKVKVKRITKKGVTMEDGTFYTLQDIETYVDQHYRAK